MCEGVARWFIDFAGLQGASSEWSPPARMMVDPAREIPAIVATVRAGLITLPEAIRSFGYDPAAVIDEIAAFNSALDTAGIVLDTDPRKTSQQGQWQWQNNGQQQND